MTKRQRLNIYKELLEYYKEELEDFDVFTVTFGMCSKLWHIIQERNIPNTIPFSMVIEVNFPELYLQKPKRRYDGYWWSRDTKIGIRKRIEAIEKAIELTKTMK